MTEPRTLDLNPDWLGIVRAVLDRHVPGRPVYAFGSRTRGRARRRSDLDLAVGGTEPLTISTITGIKEDFSESDLPIFVDVLDLNAVDAGFLQRIEPYFVPVAAGDLSA